MLKYSYYPFKTDLEKIEGSDLLLLKDVAEGWYVDYKVQALKIVDFAKHLAAFANQYGGWLFIGVEETNDGTRCAGAFSGVESKDVPNILLQIREASAAHITPEVLYEERIIDGPVENIGLESGKSIIVIGIPMSENAPHIHSSGRIYRRVSDQSKPKEETDRYILDDLWRRSAEYKKKISNFLKKIPDLPERQSKQAWAHIYLMPSARQKGPNKKLSFEDFKRCFANSINDYNITLPMGAIHTAPYGYVARQTQNNDPSLALLTFRWWHEGIARFDIPLNTYDLNGFSQNASKYKHADKFCERLYSQGFTRIMVVDYSMLIQAVGALSGHYLQFRDFLGDARDVYSCFTLRNVFYTSPFIDSAKYLQRIRELSIPVTQENSIRLPEEPTQDTMFCHDYLKEEEFRLSNNKERRLGIPLLFAAPLFLNILHCVGVLDLNALNESIDDMEMWGFDKISSIGNHQDK